MAGGDAADLPSLLHANGTLIKALAGQNGPHANAARNVRHTTTAVDAGWMAQSIRAVLPTPGLQKLRCGDTATPLEHQLAEQIRGNLAKACAMMAPQVRC